MSAFCFSGTRSTALTYAELTSSSARCRAGVEQMVVSAKFCALAQSKLVASAVEMLVASQAERTAIPFIMRRMSDFHEYVVVSSERFIPLLQM